MDITHIKLGEHIPNLPCAKCDKKQLKRTGTKSNLYFVSCDNCFHEEWVDPKDVQFTYEKPKEPKKKKDKSEGEE
jgi:hypothetical protein